MPIPVSETSRSTTPSPSTRRRRIVTRPPLGVNLIAFDNRFQTTCCRRTGSPLTTPSDGSASVSTRMNLASAAGRSVSTPWRTSATRSTSRTSSRSVPLIACDTSSRSLISRVCARALRSMVSIAVCRRRSSRSPDASMCAQPWIAVSGVRSSCDRVIRNSSLSVLAASASRRARRSPSSAPASRSLISPQPDRFDAAARRTAPAPHSASRPSGGTGRRASPAIVRDEREEKQRRTRAPGGATRSAPRSRRATRRR